jgi:hypothetical protein
MEPKRYKTLLVLSLVASVLSLFTLYNKGRLQYKVIHGQSIDLNNSEYVCRPQ